MSDSVREAFIKCPYDTRCGNYLSNFAAADKKAALAVHDRDQAERQLAKVAAENMRLRDADAEWRGVVEKLVGAAKAIRDDLVSEIVERYPQDLREKYTSYQRHFANSMTPVVQFNEALAQAEKLMGRK